MLMHVPDWDPSRKQKPREPSPFADNDEDMPRSTYSQHCAPTRGQRNTITP